VKQKREVKDATGTRIWNIEVNEEIMSKVNAKQILGVVEKHFDKFNIVNFVTALHRVAKAPDGAEAVSDPRFGKLLRTVQMLCTDGTARKDPYSLVSTLWAIAKLGLKDYEMIEAIAEEVLVQINEYGDLSAQELSQIAWSLASMKVQHTPLLTAIAEESIKKIAEAGPQDLGITAWAYAKLGVLNRPLMQAIAAESIRKMSDFTGQNMSNLAWACATLAFVDGPLMNAIASEAIKRISELSPQDLSNIAWACATLQFVH